MSEDVLLIIDLQNGVCQASESKIDHLDDLITAVNERIELYRMEKKPILWVQHCDEILVPKSYEWELLSELNTCSDDYFVQKMHANSFFHTDLMQILSNLEVNKIEICGAQTQFCIDTTIKFAHGSGFRLTMLKGMSTTYDNSFLPAKKIIEFYEEIWDRRFLRLV